MDLYEKVIHTDSKERFISFISDLKNDYLNNSESWENLSIDMFLDAIQAWVKSYHGNDIDFSNPSWKEFAVMLYMGKIYE